MKSPVVDNINKFRCLKAVKKLIPAGSVVDSYLLFGAQEELAMAEAERMIIAHTTRYIVYEFWDCVLTDPGRMVMMADDLFPKIRNVNMFAAVQETWMNYSDPYLRATLFFLLNRCSKSGLISSGELDDKNFNPLALSYLKKFKIDNFHLSFDEKADFVDSITQNTKGDYLFLPVGRFSYNLFEYGKSKGFEMTTVYHQKLAMRLNEIKKKWVIVYKNHPGVHSLYDDYNIHMINKYGQDTSDNENCEDLVIANF